MNLRLLVLLVSAAVLAGCASSKMSRIDSNRALYESWPIEIRQAVLDGQVQKGMNGDMVQMILGKPSEITSRPPDEEIWVFREGGGMGSGLSNTGISIGAGSGGVGVGVSGGGGLGGGQPLGGDYREIVFRNGQVIRGDGVQ